MVQLDASTRYCAVLGHPVRHSASPAMHNPAMMEMGLNWRYLAFDVPPEELRATIRGAMAMGFVGLNLTVPHKLLAVDMVDGLDASGRKWGAVNTLRFEGRESGGDWRPIWRLDPDRVTERRVIGYNTDADAVVRAIQEDLEIDVSKARVLVTGVGGAGKVAALRLAEAGARELYLVNRTVEKCHKVAELANELGPDAKVSIGYPAGEIDLVVNATSLGLRPGDPFPIDLRRFQWTQATSVYDMIYTPAETEFLKEAKANGLRVANGLGMLLYQGVRALEIWSEQSVPDVTMRAALSSHIYGDTKDH